MGGFLPVTTSISHWSLAHACACTHMSVWLGNKVEYMGSTCIKKQKSRVCKILQNWGIHIKVSLYSHSPATPGISPGATHSPDGDANSSSTHFSLPGRLCSSVNFLSIHFQMTFLIWALLNIHKKEQDRGRGICVWIDLHKYKYSICTHI